jgi:hypothetical protein
MHKPCYYWYQWRFWYTRLLPGTFNMYAVTIFFRSSDERVWNGLLK